MTLAAPDLELSPSAALGVVDVVVRAALPGPDAVVRAVAACTHDDLPLVSVSGQGDHRWACSLRAVRPVGLADVLGLGTRLLEAGLTVEAIERRVAEDDPLLAAA